jgi:hypothetical protein
MSIASACLPPQMPGIYRRSSATATLPIPPIAIRASNSIANLNPERPNLLLGSSLLNEDPIFSSFFQEVKALQEDDEEDAPPDSRALAEVLRLVPFSRNQLAQRWSTPRIASDGFGGLRLTWRSGQSEVRAVISGARTTRGSYIYWENGNNYETVPNFTPATLFTYLDRLLEKAAPFER